MHGVYLMECCETRWFILQKTDYCNCAPNSVKVMSVLCLGCVFINRKNNRHLVCLNRVYSLIISDVAPLSS